VKVGVLDREALCSRGSETDWDVSSQADPSVDSSEPRCLVSFEVSVRSTSSSSARALGVDVEILDLNDNSPTFPENQVSLRGCV